MKFDALVLLGNSGAGKDSCFAELDKRFPGEFVNAKFGAFNKLITAKVFDLDVAELEDKELRQVPSEKWFGLSPLDFLTVLYKGITPRLRAAYVSHLFSTIQGRTPVFTDIRNVDEARVVWFTYKNPKFFRLTSVDAPVGLNDYNIPSILERVSVIELDRDGLTVEQTVDAILSSASLF